MKINVLKVEVTAAVALAVMIVVGICLQYETYNRIGLLCFDFKQILIKNLTKINRVYSINLDSH